MLKNTIGLVLVLFCVVVFAPKASFANDVKPQESAEFIPMPATDTGASVPTQIYDANGFETPNFALGSCAGQDGWTQFTAGGGLIGTTTPQAGLNSLLLAEEVSQPTFTNIGCFSPVLGTNPGSSMADAFINVSASNGADYYMFAQTPSESASAGIINFDWLGDIDYYDYDTSTYVDSGVDWTGGTWYSLRIAIIGGTVTYYVNGAVVGTTTANGTSIEQLVFYHDNYQNAAEFASIDGVAIANGGDSLTVTMSSGGASAQPSLMVLVATFAMVLLSVAALRYRKQ